MHTPDLTFQHAWHLGMLGHTSGRYVRWLAMAVFVAAGAIAVCALVQLSIASAQVELSSRKLQDARAALALIAKPAKVTAPKFSDQQIVRLNSVIRQLNMPWSDVLNAIERHGSAHTGLTLVEPDSKKATVRIQAEAKNIDTLWTYADGFSHDRTFAGVVLLQHDTNEQDPNRPARLSFDVWLKNRPASTGERP